MINNEFDPDVKAVMVEVLGDYLAVYFESLENLQEQGAITTQSQMARHIQFSKGCRKICKEFGLDADKLDIDNFLASEFLCDIFKVEGVLSAGPESDC